MMLASYRRALGVTAMWTATLIESASLLKYLRPGSIADANGLRSVEIL